MKSNNDFYEYFELETEYGDINFYYNTFQLNSKDLYKINIITGTDDFFGDFSIPKEGDLHLTEYSHIGIEICKSPNDLLEFAKFSKLFPNIASKFSPYKAPDSEGRCSFSQVPIELVKEFLISIGCPSSSEEEKPQPCCKCSLPDTWNNKGKDGRWYCYKHCAF